MSNYYVYIKMPSYLRQWFVNRHGGNIPVRLRRGSIESKLMQRITVLLPSGAIPQKQKEGEIAIEIPYYKSHDPRIYNYVTETGKRAMLERLKIDFALDVWEFLHDFGKIGKQQKDLIYLFMEQRGIEEDGSCWDAIAKIYQRMRNIYRTNLRQKEQRNKTRNQ